MPYPRLDDDTSVLRDKEYLEAFFRREEVVRVGWSKVQKDIPVQGHNTFTCRAVYFRNVYGQFAPFDLANTNGHYITGERSK